MLISFRPRVEGQVFILLDWILGLQGQEVGLAGRQPARVHGFAQWFGSPAPLPELFRGWRSVAQRLLRACPGLHFPAALTLGGAPV